jgi:tRNA A-37 threonylcarbamoyl transferase component Bud32
MVEFIFEPQLIQSAPDFGNLPWELPVSTWTIDLVPMEDVQRGISRHPVVFIRFGEELFAIKELPEQTARTEFDLLSQIHKTGLPSVKPAGYALITRDGREYSVLFTHYLESSVPYRALFINKEMDQYQIHLLDAVSELLVQLHSNGFYWGDCSLSNVLFRRDAGALQAYLVDAETCEFHLPPLSPMLRYHDLEIVEENIFGELTDLQMNDELSEGYPVEKIGVYIQQAYRNLWEELNREVVFSQNESFRIEERIRAINSLGFSVKDIELKKVEAGNQLKLRVFVSDRNFHRNQLFEITGLKGEERQAQQILNEINEIRANMVQSDSENSSMIAVTNYWMKNIYCPVVEKLLSIVDSKAKTDDDRVLLELYCQVLEHKWYLSERMQHDVGHQTAVDDYIQQYLIPKA